MSLPPRRPHSRPLALELLEPRAVPAALAQIVELPLGSLNYNGYDVVDTSPSGFLVGASNDQQSKLLRFNDQGQLLSEVLLSPLAGYAKASISDLSENGQWAIGTSYTDGVDPATGMALGGYALTMWLVSNPSDPIAIDFPDAPGLEALSDLSNEGTFVGGTQDGRIFLVSSTSIEPLSLPAGTPAVGSVGSWYQSVPDMTAEGTTFVGSTRIADSDSRPRPYLGLNYLYQAVIWHDGQPTSLEVEPDTLSSEAVRVTDDGRLIGGRIASQAGGYQAAVWFDGKLQTFHTGAGGNLQGQVRHIINGIHGDPTQWLAFGVAYNYNFGDVAFVAGPDGVAWPLTDWLHTNYGFDGDLQHAILDDVLLSDDRLRLFTPEYGFDHALPPGSTLPQELIPTGTQMITVDLQSQSCDVNSDGFLSPADALLLINAINDQIAQGNDGSLPQSANASRLDLNRDGRLTAVDVLIVINRLNTAAASDNTAPEQTIPTAEGEPSPSDANNFFALAADELFLATGRRK